MAEALSRKKRIRELGRRRKKGKARDGWREERRERPLEFTWSDLKAGIILFSPSSSILLANHYIFCCVPPSILLYRIMWILLFLCLFLLLIALKEKNSSFITCFCVTTYRQNNERKSEKKRDFLSFYFLSICIYFRNNQRLDQFHIIQYIFIPTYLYVIEAVCVMIKHAFPSFIATPIATRFHPMEY